jgi:RNA polymerase sigma factor (sigma-70 family)
MEKHSFMQACRQGGAALDSALRALHEDYARALFRDARLAIGNAESARDLVQDALVKAWRRCAQFRGDSELYPWLKRILRHAVIDYLRSSRPEQPLTDDQGQPLAEVEAALREAAGALAASPEQAMQGREIEAVYRACQARFAHDHPLPASVIRWIAEDDLTNAEIGALLQREPGATREYISQCRKKARVYFADWYRLVLQDDDPAAGTSPSL